MLKYVMPITKRQIEKKFRGFNIIKPKLLLPKRNGHQLQRSLVLNGIATSKQKSSLILDEIAARERRARLAAIEADPRREADAWNAMRARTSNPVYERIKNTPGQEERLWADIRARMENTGVTKSMGKTIQKTRLSPKQQQERLQRIGMPSFAERIASTVGRGVGTARFATDVARQGINAIRSTKKSMNKRGTVKKSQRLTQEVWHRALGSESKGVGKGALRENKKSVANALLTGRPIDIENELPFGFSDYANTLDEKLANAIRQFSSRPPVQRTLNVFPGTGTASRASIRTNARNFKDQQKDIAAQRFLLAEAVGHDNPKLAELQARMLYPNVAPGARNRAIARMQELDDAASWNRPTDPSFKQRVKSAQRARMRRLNNDNYIRYPKNAIRDMVHEMEIGHADDNRYGPGNLKRLRRYYKQYGPFFHKDPVVDFFVAQDARTLRRVMPFTGASPETVQQFKRMARNAMKPKIISTADYFDAKPLSGISRRRAMQSPKQVAPNVSPTVSPIVSPNSWASKYRSMVDRGLFKR